MAAPSCWPTAFPEFGHTRMSVPGELVTTSVSLEYPKAKDVDDVFAKATGLGAKGETSPTQSFWGTRVATFRDPFRPPLDIKRPAEMN